MEIKHKLEENQTLEKYFRVEANHTADHIGSGSVKVLSTPMMMFSSVGSQVNISHLAPSPLGSKIRVKAGITNIQGRKVTLNVEAWEGNTQIGSGTHVRYLIDSERFMKKLDQSQSADS
jgi:predicted thioesterase